MYVEYLALNTYLGSQTNSHHYLTTVIMWMIHLILAILRDTHCFQQMWKLSLREFR